MEAIGPELRQYIISGNDERPFSRDQRRWVYASAKKENNYFGFGTDNDTENAAYPIIKQRTFADVIPASPIHGTDVVVPGAKVLGAPRGRRQAFRPASVVNVSAMTWIGSGKLGLPGNAIVAFALGVDLINVAREAMLAIGCIQAQKCHTDHCPTGVATQNA